MNALTKVWNATRAGFKAFAMRWSGQGGGPTPLAELFNFGRSRYNYPSDVAGGRGNSIIMSVIGWIMRNFPQAEFQVVELNDDGTENPIFDHELSALIESPNPFYSGENLFYATILDLETAGNAYWMIAKSTMGTIAELWWIPQQLIRPRWNENGSKFIEWYDYTPDPSRTDVIYKIPPEEIVHYRDGIDADNTRLGISKLKSLMREIWTDDECANFVAALMRNYAVPSVIIAPDDNESEISTEEAEAMKLRYVQGFGNDNRGAPMFLSGPVKVQIVSHSPAEMNLVGLRRVPEERVTAVYGVNAIVAGLGVGLEHSTFRNYKEARAAAYEECILPLHKLIAKEIRRSLLPLFSTASVGSNKPQALAAGRLSERAAEPTPISGKKTTETRFTVRFDTSKLSVFQEDQASRARTANMLVTGGWVMVGTGMRMMGMHADASFDYYLRKTGTNPVPLADAAKPPEIPDPLAAQAGKPSNLDPTKKPAPAKEEVAA